MAVTPIGRSSRQNPAVPEGQSRAWAPSPPDLTGPYFLRSSPAGGIPSRRAADATDYFPAGQALDYVIRDMVCALTAAGRANVARRLKAKMLTAVISQMAEAGSQDHAEEAIP